MKKVVFLFMMFSLTLMACKETKIVEVKSSLIDCEGVSKQKCLQYRLLGEDNWQLFYGDIDGFTYEEGYNYELEVDVEKVENPPADGSDLKYTLKKVLKKEKDQLFAHKILNNNLDIKKLEQDKKKPVVIYDSNTRGFHFKLSVYEEYFMLAKQRGAIGEKFELNADDLKEIKNLISKLQLTELSKLEAPTKLRHHDGAPHTSVTVFQGEEEYRSSTFDGGHPPKELEALVNKILSLADKK